MVPKTEGTRTLRKMGYCDVESSLLKLNNEPLLNKNEPKLNKNEPQVK